MTVDVEAVDTKIREALPSYKKGDCEFEVYQIKEEKDKLYVDLHHGFGFDDVRPLVKAVLSTGLKKFGRDKLIAYQTCAECYFKNYVTKDGEFLDSCGDCYEDGTSRR